MSTVTWRGTHTTYILLCREVRNGVHRKFSNEDKYYLYKQGLDPSILGAEAGERDTRR